MVKLEMGNCRVNGSQRRQLNAWLKRAIQLGERVGDFVLTITVRRIGRAYQFIASVHDSAGEFVCRARGARWAHACRALIKALTARLHDQRVHGLAH